MASRSNEKHCQREKLNLLLEAPKILEKNLNLENCGEELMIPTTCRNEKLE